jgi:hypothetical protein
VFVCVQLVFLPLSNLIQFVPREPTPLPDEILGRHQKVRQVSPEPIQSAIDSVGHASDRWAEATAQNQSWSLFAPRFGSSGTFLTLDVRSRDGKRSEVRSRFEPADVSDYLRYDVLNYRLFYREMSFAFVYANWKTGGFEEQPDEWAKAIRKYVTTFRRSMIAYIRWRTNDGQPEEIIVNVRVYPPPELGEANSKREAATLPLARWNREQPEQLEMFDPRTNRFER